MSFESIRPLADTILFEGYALYPYRASSLKNRFRWTFGVLAPHAWTETGGTERSSIRMQALVEPEGDGPVRVSGRLRFLQLEQRRLEERRGEGFAPVERLEVDGRLEVAWDEGVLHEIEWVIDDAQAAADTLAPIPFVIPGARSDETIEAADGAAVGHRVRERSTIRGRITMRTERIAGERPLVGIEVRIENVTPFPDSTARRNEVLPSSLLSAHLCATVDGGAFVSLLDPPDWARAAVTARVNEGTFPVLVGPEGSRASILSSAFVLYDHVSIAPESDGDSFDATEIDALIGLSTRTLTDDEKREARAMDARTRAIVDRSEALTRQHLERLHGAIRELDVAPPGSGAGPSLRPGCRVRLVPGRHRADAQDFLMAGMIATVARVEVDVDGTEHAAVTIDADPAADLHRWYGRFHYFRADELELLADPSADARSPDERDG